MTGATTDAPAVRWALYYKGGRKGRWQLHAVFDTEAEAWAAVRACPLKHLAFLVSPVPVSEADTELTPAGVKNRSARRPAAGCPT